MALVELSKLGENKYVGDEGDASSSASSNVRMEMNRCVPSAEQLHFKKLTEMSENRLQSDNSSFSNGSYFCIALCVTIVTVAILEREKRVYSVALSAIMTWY